MRGRKYVQKIGQEETDERQEIGSEERTGTSLRKAFMGKETVDKRQVLG